MDYYTMKRNQLQSLCKQHNIPANSANSVLAHKLSQLLNEKQKPTTRKRTCLKSPVETPVEGEPAVSKKEAKKVRFSPNNDFLEYELRSGKNQKDVVIERKGRRKSVANKVDKQVVNDNNSTAELIDDGAQNPVRLTRSRVQVSGKDGVISNNEKKKGRKAAKDVEKVTDVGKEPGGNIGKVTRSKVHTLNKGAVVQLDENKQIKREIKDVKKTNESVEVGRVRVTRSKAQSLMEDAVGSDVNPQLKKSSGRRVAKEAHSVELSREITDIPVRVTRNRGQILKEDNGNTVTNDQCVKKRTRKEMKSTDWRINLGNVAPDDNQELPKRKSLRTRGVESVDEDEAKKLGRGKQKQRSKESVADVPESQHHADKGPRQSRRNVAKVEDTEVSNQNVCKVEIVNDRRVTRSKHQRDSKLDHQPDEPSDQGEKKVVNRRKSVMQKAQGKGIYKPFVGKRESSKATVMVESPTRETRKTVGKTRSKEQSGNLSLTDEGLDDIKNVTRSGTDASANEIKAVVNPTRSPKSRKRRGTPIVEDQTVETEYISPVDESPRQFALRSSKNEGKSVAKKQLESSLKTPASRKNNQLAVQNAYSEVIKENSSKKRAKLSGTNQRYSENHSEKSSVKGTPVSKLGNFELDEEVTETESTRATESHRRVTRSAIRTVGKEPSQSAIQDQPIGDAQFSSRKVARFRPNPAVNTAPGRVTRSGIKHGGKASIIFSEKVDKKKQVGQSALRKQRLDATQISSPEGAEVRLNPDVDTIGVQSEISKASGSVKLPPVVPEENMVSLTGTAIVMENLSPVSGENASGIESHTISNIKMTPAIMAEKPEVYETKPDAVSDGSHLQNETLEVSVKTAIFSEAEVQVALNSEKPMADENEMDLTKLGSTSKGLQIDLMAEEPAISADKTVVMEENEAGSSAICHVSVEQSDVNGKSKEMEDQVGPTKIENVTQSIEDDGSYAQIAKESEQDDLTCKDSLQNDSVDEREATDNGKGDDEDESASVQKPLMNEPVSEDRGVADGVDAQKVDESDKENVITTGQRVNEHGELSTDKSVVNCLTMESSGVKFEVVQSTDNDVHEVPILGKSDGEDEGANVTKEGEIDSMLLTDGNMLEDDGGASAIDYDTYSLPSSAGNKLEDALFGSNDGEDGSANTTGNMIEDPGLSGDIYDDVEADGGTYVPKELETGLEPANVPVSINDVCSDFENNRLTSKDGHAMDDQNVGGEDSEPATNENTPVVTEVSIRYRDQEPEQVFNAAAAAADEVPCDTVGICASVRPSDSSTNIEAPHTQATAAITVDPLEESVLDINKEAVSNILGDTYDTHTENDSGTERKFSELDEGVQPKESEISPPDMTKEQTSEKAEMTSRNDHVLDDQEDHTVATVDLDLDGGKFMEDCSNHGGEELDSELVGIINSDENPTREENSPIVQSKEHSSHVMGDIGAHESPITKGSLPITYMHQESHLDGTHSDLPTFLKEDDRNQQSSTSVDWGDYGFEMGEFQNSVAENGSDDVLDKSRKEFQTSVGASSSSEENSRVAADMVNSVKNLEMASKNVANEKSGQEVDMLKENVNADMTDEVFNWSDLSLKYLFKTPGTSRIGQVEYGQDDAVDFSNQDHCETQGNATTHSSENVTYGNIEEYTRKFFGDDSSDDGSGKDKNLELNGDQVDQTKRFDLSSEAVGTSRFLASGVKDNPIYSHELEKKEETKLKGPFDDLDFDKGM